MLIVIMMQEKAKPQQSWVYMKFARNTPPIWIPIPNMEAEPVRIIKMDGSILTLQARNSSNVYYFDTLARQLLDSPGRNSHTATPALTFLPMKPAPTSTPVNPHP